MTNTPVTVSNNAAPSTVVVGPCGCFSTAKIQAPAILVAIISAAAFLIKDKVARHRKVDHRWDRIDVF